MNELLTDLKAMSVLLVDDEASIRISMELMLRGKTRLVRTAADGETALEILRNDRWDIIICDYMLPGMNGFDFFKQVDEAYPGTIKILITGFIDPATREKAKRARIHEFMEKPLTTEAIFETLERALLRHKNHDLKGLGKPSA
ncbi:response regulator [bacterium]|nr:response regulator [bacterium]